MSTPGIPGGTAGGSSSEPLALQPGLSYEFSERVEHSLTVQSHDPAMPAVYATPAMVLAMERAAGRAVESALPPGTLTLGTAIHVEHLAATPEGMQVTVRAELVRVDGRFLEFRVEARDERELIGRGTVGRAIVDRARFAAKVTAKKAAGS